MFISAPGMDDTIFGDAVKACTPVRLKDVVLGASSKSDGCTSCNDPVRSTPIQGARLSCSPRRAADDAIFCEAVLSTLGKLAKEDTIDTVVDEMDDCAFPTPSTCELHRSSASTLQANIRRHTTQKRLRLSGFAEAAAEIKAASPMREDVTEDGHSAPLTHSSMPKIIQVVSACSTICCAFFASVSTLQGDSHGNASAPAADAVHDPASRSPIPISIVGTISCAVLSVGAALCHLYILSTCSSQQRDRDQASPRSHCAR